MNKPEYEIMYTVEQTHWWYVGLRQLLFFWLKKLKPQNILDVGCGTGINLKTSLDSGYTGVGIDPNNEAIKFCKTRGLVEIKKGKVEEKIFTDSSFDIAYCMDILYLLDEDKLFKGLKNINRYLKPKGHLIINSATYQWLYSTHDIAVHTYKRYSKKELEKYLRKSGFKIIKSTYRVCLLFPIIAFVKVLEKFMLFFSRKEHAKIKGDLEKSSILINKLLKPVMSFENLLLKKFNLPFGSSVFIVAQKI